MERSKLSSLWFSAAVLGLAIDLSGCSREASASSLPAEAVVSVPITQVTSRSVSRDLVLTGTLVGNRESHVASDAVGKVTATFAERGELVKKGAPIARLDASNAALSSAEATAQVEAARAEQAHAKLECDRAEKLFSERVISRAEYDRMRTSCITAGFSAEAAQARSRMATKSVGDATVRAPFTGVIVQRHVTVGEYVQPGAKIATLVELDPLRLEIAVPEHSIGSVKDGMLVSFDVSAYPNQRFAGTVRYVGPSLRRAGRDLVIEAVVSNSDKKLYPGMFATARIAIGSETKPVIPASALSGNGRSRRAFVVQEKHLEERVVLVGEPVETGFTVLSGVTVGERVAARTGGDVKDGARVE
jgi:membrane fusion protein (multidrug efflux system)